MNNLIKNEYAKFWIENDILFYVYKNGVEITLEVAIQIVKDRILFQQGKSYVMLCDIRGIKKVDKNARDYLATEGSVLLKAVALLSNTPLSEIISDFYVKTSPPSIVTKEFNDYEEALSYLNAYNPA